MYRSTVLRRLLLNRPTLRTSLFPPPRSFTLALPRTYASSSPPSIIQSSFWISLIPKPFRRTSPSPTSTQKAKKAKSKEWNPATFFIIIFLLIGSMSIQMIALRNDILAFSRRADAKIGLLREIVERIKNGEKDIDVEGLLGTGNKEKEDEWEEVLREIEEEDQAWQLSQRKKPKHGKNLEAEKSNNPSKPKAIIPDKEEHISKAKSNAPSGFY